MAGVSWPVSLRRGACSVSLCEKGFCVARVDSDGAKGSEDAKGKRRKGSVTILQRLTEWWAFASAITIFCAVAFGFYVLSIHRGRFAWLIPLTMMLVSLSGLASVFLSGDVREEMRWPFVISVITCAISAALLTGSAFLPRGDLSVSPRETAPVVDDGGSKPDNTPSEGDGEEEQEGPTFVW